MNVYEDTYLLEILHMISQGLLAPTMIVIIALIVVSIFIIGQLVVEFFTQHRHYKQNAPEIVNAINEAARADINEVVAGSKLLNFQKSALTTVTNNLALPAEPLFALAQMEVNGADKLYRRRLAWTDTIAKVGPLLGLMGTLIPLGPGIVALGQGDTVALSQSLLVAFDATVCGLVCAIVALIISKLRSGWYAEYMTTLESLMSCILDKATPATQGGE
jgi:biopolymer transport protein ExbB/TolQ